MTNVQMDYKLSKWMNFTHYNSAPMVFGVFGVVKKCADLMLQLDSVSVVLDISLIGK
jgi:hypothetical protein